MADTNRGGLNTEPHLKIVLKLKAGPLDKPKHVVGRKVLVVFPLGTSSLFITGGRALDLPEDRRICIRNHNTS